MKIKQECKAQGHQSCRHSTIIFQCQMTTLVWLKKKKVFLQMTDDRKYSRIDPFKVFSIIAHLGWEIPMKIPQQIDYIYIYIVRYISYNAYIYIYIYCFFVGIEMCGQDEILHIVASHGITLCQHHINNWRLPLLTLRNAASAEGPCGAAVDGNRWAH